MKNDGGPAFPGGEAVMEIHMTGPDGIEDVRTISPPTGLSIRDWYAGQAMRSLLDSSDNVSDDHLPELWQAVSEQSYDLADAMLAEREKRDAE